MADVVQYRLERMVDVLDDLEQRGLFSRAEISEIVRRRRDFEFRLKRPSPLKSDFLAYIDYERRLDDLRNLRKRAIISSLREQEEEEAPEKSNVDKKKKRGRNKLKDGVKWKKSISDKAGVLRILDIYAMATARFKGDLDLWMSYLEFCRERQHGRMSKVLVEAVRFHPKVPHLWIDAAAWEFNRNLNVGAARVLMQHGLRECPKSEDLWIEYLRMELTYLNKLKARKVALGDDVKTFRKDYGEKEADVEAFISLKEVDDVDELDQQQGALGKKEDLFWQLGWNILQTIYQGAIEALPSSLSLRKRFLVIQDEVDLAHSNELKIEMMDALRRDFAQDEEYWDWLARYQMGDTRNIKVADNQFLPKLRKVVEVYEEALKVLPATTMFSLYAKFLSDIIFLDREDYSSVMNSSTCNSAEFISSLENVYERAEASGSLSEDLAYCYISFYLQIGRLEEARKLAKNLCTGKFTFSARLWSLRASLEIRWLMNEDPSFSKDGLHCIIEILEDALNRLSDSKAECLWIAAFKLLSNNKKKFEKLVNSLVTAIAKSGGTEGGYMVASAVLNWVILKDGIKRGRKMYKRFLSLPHPSLAFYRACIEHEANLGLVGEKDCIIHARQLYESALSIYNQDRDLWRDYYMMEIKVGTSGTANAVYGRIEKSLMGTFGLTIAHERRA